MPTQQTHVAFSRFSEEHIPLFHAWLDKPHVARWWQGEPEGRIRQRLNDPHYRYLFVALIEGQPIGYVQVYEATGPFLNSASGCLGIDMFIGEECYINQG